MLVQMEQQLVHLLLVVLVVPTRAEAEAAPTGITMEIPSNLVVMVLLLFGMKCKGKQYGILCKSS
jgi:hypothetical protein